ncbi:MAG: multiheme c-type cytochrome [Candidatus Thiodiazotropha sp.]
MNPSCMRQFLFCILVCTHAISFAAKVSIDPSEWGDPLGEECVSCHEKSSSGLAQQWHKSAHAEAGVNCLDCHKASVDDIDAITHEGQVIATIVSPLDCSRCHTVEYEQQKGSVHSEAVSLIENRLPALAGHVGGDAIVAAGCDQCHGSKVEVRGDGSLDPRTWPNSGIGRINPDGSKGSCSSCHGKHRFSKAQAREPSACVRCHSGPDSPDKGIYEASKHGMLFVSHRDEMALDSDSWIAGKDYVAAPTCVTCHMGAAGKLKANHDVGMRNAWSLNTPVSTKQYLVVFEDGEKLELPASEAPPKRGSELTKADGSMGKVKAVATPKRRRQAMQLVCLECHSKAFTKSFMDQFDAVVNLFNEKFGIPATQIMQALYAEGLLTPTPFDEPIEFIYWELWHDEGARARHGASMASANHTWWEGMYLVGRNFYAHFLPQVKQIAGKERADELIQKTIGSSEHHQWMKQPQKTNPILGYDRGSVSTGKTENE